MSQISLAVQIFTQRNVMRKVWKCQHEAISKKSFLFIYLPPPPAALEILFIKFKNMRQE